MPRDIKDQSWSNIYNTPDLLLKNKMSKLPKDQALRESQESEKIFVRRIYDSLNKFIHPADTNEEVCIETKTSKANNKNYKGLSDTQHSVFKFVPLESELITSVSPSCLKNRKSFSSAKHYMKPTEASALSNYYSSRSPSFSNKLSFISTKHKNISQRSRSDKNRSMFSKNDNKSNFSFKYCSTRQISKTNSKNRNHNEHSQNSKSQKIKSGKVSMPNKDYFGSKKNEARYNRLKKKGVNNPLNIMNRAVINLNNSRTNSESSQERCSQSRESTKRTGKSFVKFQDKEQKTNSTVAFKANYDNIITCLNQKQKDNLTPKTT